MSEKGVTYSVWGATVSTFHPCVLSKPRSEITNSLKVSSEFLSQISEDGERDRMTQIVWLFIPLSFPLWALLSYLWWFEEGRGSPDGWDHVVASKTSATRSCHHSGLPFVLGWGTPQGKHPVGGRASLRHLNFILPALGTHPHLFNKAETSPVYALENNCKHRGRRIERQGTWWPEQWECRGERVQRNSGSSKPKFT